MPRKSASNLFEKPGSPYWWYEFQVSGQRFRASTGTANEREAKGVAKAAKERAQLEDKQKARGAVPHEAVYPLDELVVKYGEAVKDQLTGWRNIQRDLARILRFFAAVEADEDGEPMKPLADPNYRPAKKVNLITDIRDGHVRTFVRQRSKDRVIPHGSKRKASDSPYVSAGTVNHTLIRLQALFAYAKDKLKIRFEAEPNWREHKLKVSRKPARIFKGDEQVRFQKAIRPDFAPIFAFAFESAKRFEYCVNLKWSQVHWERGVIEKPGKRKPGGVEKIERVFITPEIKAILKPLKGHHPVFVFTYITKSARDGHKSGVRKPITPNYLDIEFRRTTKRAGIENFGFHSLRRSGATEIYHAAGKDLLLTQRFLGHASPQTTALYIGTDDADIRAAMQKRAANRSGQGTPSETA